MKTGLFARISGHFRKSWKHHVSLQLATLVVLIASFTVVVGVLTFTHNLYRILTLWGESMQVSVYLAENAPAENITNIQRLLEQNDKFDKIHYVTSEEALQTFREQMASYAPDLLADKDLLKFIPSSFQFGIAKSVALGDQLNTIQEAAQALKGMPGIEDVSFGQEWVRSYSALTRALTWGGAVFTVIILVSAAFVMANSVHTSIAQRRSEIEVMELIGATTRYIRTPFIWEGAILGGLSSLVATAFSFGLYLVIRDYLHSQISFLQLSSHIRFIGPELIGSTLIFGVIMGAVSSWLCVRRINDGWAASESSRP